MERNTAEQVTKIPLRQLNERKSRNLAEARQKMPRLAVLALAILAMVSTPAGAELDQRYLANRDGRATVSDEVFAALTGIYARNGGSIMTGANAAHIVSLVMADGKLDAAETDLLEELADSNIRAVTIRREGSPEPSVVFGTQGGDAGKALDAALDAPLIALWNGDHADWGALVTLHATGPAPARDRVAKLTLNYMLEAARQSEAANAYGPFRQVISSRFALANKLPPEAQQHSRALLYDAAQSAHSRLPDRTPRYLFDWLAPKPTP
jgi:hypothetical protein